MRTVTKSRMLPQYLHRKKEVSSGFRFGRLLTVSLLGRLHRKDHPRSLGNQVARDLVSDRRQSWKTSGNKESKFQERIPLWTSLRSTKKERAKAIRYWCQVQWKRKCKSMSWKQLRLLVLTREQRKLPRHPRNLLQEVTQWDHRKKKYPSW